MEGIVEKTASCPVLIGRPMEALVCFDAASVERSVAAIDIRRGEAGSCPTVRNNGISRRPADSNGDDDDNR